MSHYPTILVHYEIISFFGYKKKKKKKGGNLVHDPMKNFHIDLQVSINPLN